MALFRFQELTIDNSKQMLKEQGYWFYSKRIRSTMVVPVPLRPAALVINWMYVLVSVLGLLLFIGGMVNPAGNSFLDSYGWFLVGGLAGLLVLIRLALIGKTYYPDFKEYRAQNYGKRDGLYTSGESLYTTKLEGIYVCVNCSTPVASTDDKIVVEGHEVRVSRLFDDGNGLDIADGVVRCSVCEVHLGKAENGEFRIDGEKLALDAGELHYIYPDNKA